jgi:hypothetical protein
LYFCEEYRDGREIGVSDVFIIGSGGGYFTCMIDLRDDRITIGTRKVTLKIYRVYGSDEEYITSEKFDVEPDWDYIFFDKFHTFYSAGKYKVVAYNSYGDYVASGKVTIKMR